MSGVYCVSVIVFGMASASSLLLLIISHLSILSLAEQKTLFHPKCPSFPCGILGQIKFPFSNRTNPECGLFIVDNCNKQDGQKIQLGKDGPQFYITDIKLDYTLQLRDLEFEKPRQHGSCISLQNVTLPTSAYLTFNVPSNETMLKCPSTHTNDIKNTESHQLCNDSTHSLVYNSSGNENMRLKLGIGIGIGGLVALIVVLSIFTKRHKKRKYASSNFHSSSVLSSKSDLEAGSVYLGVPIFSYSELAEATNNFSLEKELGEGGFGTVYYGKLRDGREVAVKRLYEHNYRRVEQFINEIKILTGLRHKNLVSLYGCTSRHSQGLLLVYEFIPNGTVADHLHGD
ncbi:hypothetical protein LWI29_013323 [Acer saccharum]|uniref:Protein kinase domain-containing protein n=1 Tax=Acer saccharum TaxID=4024 RepID=A0AA39RGU3_ACESA|nr:hypothetical protein LWI29_013323 [Acer saccharum]